MRIDAAATAHDIEYRGRILPILDLEFSNPSVIEVLIRPGMSGVPFQVVVVSTTSSAVIGGNSDRSAQPTQHGIYDRLEVGPDELPGDTTLSDDLKSYEWESMEFNFERFNRRAWTQIKSQTT